eukprot:TRINITY_DN81533_c0_g1_i1.p1 TRINITY_DN81533_c0_g1~~TRINITY_DN81533_c0_g1_i1.p1  ORF type:complete len:436 (-),score=42.59 TRINITY_DN81533_c0_g1_i1:290-1597(-)
MYNNDYTSKCYYPYGYVPWLEQPTTPYVPDQYYAASPSVCLDHLKGICTDKRVRCKFAHPPLPGHAPVQTQISDNQVCSVWVLTGFCKFGAKCRYYHPPSAEATAVCAPAITTKMMAFLAKQACWTPEHSDSEGISDCGESEDAVNSDYSGDGNIVASPPISPEKTSLANTPVPHSPSDAVETLVRKVTGILNRITPEKFESLSRQLIELVGQDDNRIATALSLVIAKCCTEEPLVEVYSRLCKALYFATPARKRNYVSSTVLELGRKIIYDTPALSDSLINDEVALAKFQAKRLACVRFLGQLFLDDLIDCAPIMEVIDFFSQGCFGPLEDDPTVAFNIEMLCKLLCHAGKRLDEVWKDAVQPYYDLLQGLLHSITDSHCGRIRVLISNLLDLRTAQKWVPRREEDKPRPISSPKRAGPLSTHGTHGATHILSH